MPERSSEDAGGDLNGNLGKISAIYVCGLLAAVIILAMAEQLGAPAHYVAIGIVCSTLATYALIGVLARTSDAREYFVAGRRVPAAFNGMALAAQCLAAGGFVGLTGTLYVLGFDGTAVLLGLMSGLVLLGVLIVPYLRKLGAYTVPDFFAARYGAFPAFLSVLLVLTTSLALLVAQLHAIGLLSSQLLGVSYVWAVWAGAAMLVVSALPGGMKSASWTEAAQYLVILIALLTPLLLVPLGAADIPVPLLSYGEALQRITALETALVENQLADPATLKPHTAPFLQLDRPGYVALVVTLMAGIAAMPQLIMRPLTAPNVRQARLSVAWASFFMLLLALSAPACAAFAKLNLFSLIDKGARFDSLPAWMEDASRRDLLRIHDVSLHLLDATAAATASGTRDAGTVEASLRAQGSQSASAFAGLSEPVREALIEAAAASAAGSAADRWRAFRGTVLPAAAKAAGNETGALVEGGIWIDPRALVLMLPEMLGQPRIVMALVLAGALAAALAAATGVLIAASHALGHDLYARLIDRRAPPGRRLAVNRFGMLLMIAGAGYVAMHPPGELMTVAMWTFSLAAAGLLPALVLGIWWKRTNAYGAVAGMIGGFSLCLYYMVGTQLFPVAFHDLWSPLVPTSDIALEELARLRAEWLDAEGDAKTSLALTIEAAARGTPMQAGAASWLSIPNVCAGVIAVPFGFLTVVLASLLTPRPRAERVAIVEAMRIPRGPEILDHESEGANWTPGLLAEESSVNPRP